MMKKKDVSLVYLVSHIIMAYLASQASRIARGPASFMVSQFGPDWKAERTTVRKVIMNFSAEIHD